MEKSKSGGGGSIALDIKEFWIALSIFVKLDISL
jgi:hypothetical protein